MRFKEWDDYLDSMLRYVRFSPDRHRIRTEFEEHMNDMFDDYVSDGMPEDEAKAAVLDNIGDSTEVGRLMNKAHNAVIGWVWQVLKVCLIIALLCCFFPMAQLTIEVAQGIINTGRAYEDNMSHGEYVYSIELDETVTVDNHTLKFDHLTKYVDQGVNEYVISFRDYRKILDGTGDSFAFRLTENMFTDDLGEAPIEVTETFTPNVGFVYYRQVSFTGFSDDAKQIIIEYRGYEHYYKGRHFMITIELPDSEG